MFAQLLNYQALDQAQVISQWEAKACDSLESKSIEMTQIKCRPPTVSYLASSVKPHCAQAWRGDQPSLSRASMKALFSSNIFAISTLPSILTCRDLCIKKQPNLELKIICKMSGCKCVLRKPPPPFYTGPPYPWQIITVLLTCTM